MTRLEPVPTGIVSATAAFKLRRTLTNSLIYALQKSILFKIKLFNFITPLKILLPDWDQARQDTLPESFVKLNPPIISNRDVWYLIILYRKISGYLTFSRPGSFNPLITGLFLRFERNSDLVG
jgi:hypothetical protein